MTRRDATTAERRLSARSTLLCRLVLPAAWIVGLGAGVLAPWLPLLTGGGLPADWRFRAGFVLLWAIGAGYLVSFARPLRDVWIRGDHLRVRNFLAETRIPLDAIERVEDSRYLRPKLVQVILEHRPGLPEKVTFIPALRRLFPVGPHPVMRELHAAVRRDDRDEIDAP